MAPRMDRLGHILWHLEHEQASLPFLAACVRQRVCRVHVDTQRKAAFGGRRGKQPPSSGHVHAHAAPPLSSGHAH
eukprot:118845-Chlamydomonas_euryale.AAC.1